MASYKQCKVYVFQLSSNTVMYFRNSEDSENHDHYKFVRYANKLRRNLTYYLQLIISIQNNLLILTKSQYKWSTITTHETSIPSVFFLLITNPSKFSYISQKEEKINNLIIKDNSLPTFWTVKVIHILMLFHIDQIIHGVSSHKESQPYSQFVSKKSQMLSLQRISFRLVVKNTQPSNLFFIECALNSFIYYP